jgi:hypothetical protein
MSREEPGDDPVAKLLRSGNKAINMKVGILSTNKTTTSGQDVLWLQLTEEVLDQAGRRSKSL